MTTSDSFGGLHRANMDGTNRTIIESQKIFYPTSLILDLANEHIYWLDKYMDCVERIDYDGNKRWSLKAFIGSTMRPMQTIALFENFIYFTKRNTHFREIWRINRRNTNLAEKLFTTDEQPNEVRIFHAQIQPTIENLCDSKLQLKCQHLCVLTRNDHNLLVAKCICRAGYQLKSQGECIFMQPTSMLIYAKQSPAMIRGITISNDMMNNIQESIVPILNVKWPLSLDYNAKSELIYFSQNDM